MQRGEKKRNIKHPNCATSASSKLCWAVYKQFHKEGNQIPLLVSISRITRATFPHRNQWIMHDQLSSGALLGGKKKIPQVEKQGDKWLRNDNLFMTQLVLQLLFSAGLHCFLCPSVQKPAFFRLVNSTLTLTYKCLNIKVMYKTNKNKKLF